MSQTPATPAPNPPNNPPNNPPLQPAIFTHKRRIMPGLYWVHGDSPIYLHRVGLHSYPEDAIHALRKTKREKADQMVDELLEAIEDAEDGERGVRLMMGEERGMEEKTDKEMVEEKGEEGEMHKGEGKGKEAVKEGCVERVLWDAAWELDVSSEFGSGSGYEGSVEE